MSKTSSNVSYGTVQSRAGVSDPARDTIVLLLGQILAQVIAFPVGILIARTTGLLQYGQYSTATAFVGVFAGLLLMGSEAIVARECAKYPSLSALILTSALVPAILWSVLVIILINGLAYLLGYSNEVRVLLWFVSAESAIISVLSLVRASFRGVSKMHWDTVTVTFQSIVGLLIIVVVALGRSGSIICIAVALLISRAIVLAAVIPCARRELTGRFTLSVTQAKAIILTALPIGIAGLISSVYLRLDAVLLGLWRSEQDVGLYTIAYNLAYVWLPVSISLARAMVPQLSLRFYQSDRREFLTLFGKGLRYNLIIGLPIAAVIGLLSTQWISILYGGEFEEAGPALGILGIAVGLVFLNTYFLNVLVAIGEQRLLPGIMASGLVVMVVFSAVLVPRFGFVGTAMSVVTRECVTLGLFTYQVIRALGRESLRAVTWTPFLAASVMSVCIFVLRESWSAIPLAAASGLTYLTILIMAGGLDLSELSIGNKIFHSRREDVHE